MRYLSDIRNLIEFLLGNPSQHVLVISGPSGWAKTASIRKILGDLEVGYSLLGAYSTPLGLYNKLAAGAAEDDNLVARDLHILDDTAGVLNNAQALSILNAASWPSAGQGNKRRIVWTSARRNATLPHFYFEGKLIVLTNYMTELPQARAFVNRALNYKIEIRAKEIRSLFLEAAKSREYFPNRDQAAIVARFVADQAKNFAPGKISLRDLTRAYEFASYFPETAAWQNLFLKTLPPRGIGDISPREKYN